MQLSYSKISTWKQCRKSYEWQYILKLEPRIIRPEIGLGRAIHETLANFYSHEPIDRVKDILDSTYENSMYQSQEELEIFKSGLEQKDKDNFTKNLEKGRLWLNRYWDKYSIDESIPRAETEKLMEVKFDDIVFVIKPDMIVNKEDGTWIWENKSGNPDIQQLLLEDEQSLYYTFGLRKLGYDAKGVIYNIISNPTSISDGLIREETERTNLELKGLEDEIKQIANEIQTLPKYPSRGFGCKWCFFRELCRGIAYGADVEFLINQHFIKKEVIK